MITGYTLIMIKLVLGILCLVLQINLMGKGNLAPNSAIDQVQNYVLGGIIGGVIYNEARSHWSLAIFAGSHRMDYRCYGASLFVGL